MQRKLMTFALALSILNAAGPAHAYIGPGAGLGAIALTIALAVGVVLLVVGFVWYPVKRMMKSRKSDTPTVPSRDS